MNWSDLANFFATKAKSSSGPPQWLWGVLGFAAAFVGGYVLAKRADILAAEKADIEIQKKRAAAMQQLAAVAKNEDAAAHFAQLAQQTLDQARSRDAAYAIQKTALEAQLAKIKAAQSWKDLQS